MPSPPGAPSPLPSFPTHKLSVLRSGAQLPTLAAALGGRSFGGKAFCLPCAPLGAFRMPTAVKEEHA